MNPLFFGQGTKLMNNLLLIRVHVHAAKASLMFLLPLSSENEEYVKDFQNLQGDRNATPQSMVAE
jgi:hypothetical protein